MPELVNCPLVQAHGRHLAHITKVRHARHAHGLESQAAIVCDHLRQYVEDGLQSGVMNSQRKRPIEQVDRIIK